MHRFRTEQPVQIGECISLSPQESAHALRVLRLKTADEIQLIDSLGRLWSARITNTDAIAEAVADFELKSTEAPVEVTLYMGLPKGEKLELIAQKLTEIGAARIVPVRMERSVARIEKSEAEKKLSRVRRIAEEAQKQSGRCFPADICYPIDFAALPKMLKQHDTALLLWEEARGYRVKDAFTKHPCAKNIAYIVGPEGGITKDEAQSLIEAGAEAITMGPRILRAETAAIAGCAAILTLWGDL